AVKAPLQRIAGSFNILVMTDSPRMRNKEAPSGQLVRLSTKANFQRLSHDSGWFCGLPRLGYSAAADRRNVSQSRTAESSANSREWLLTICWLTRSCSAGSVASLTAIVQ